MQDMNEALKKRLRVMVADMEETQQADIIEVCAAMLAQRERGSNERHLAEKLKAHLEESYGGVDQWNVVVGGSFGCDEPSDPSQGQSIFGSIFSRFSSASSTHTASAPSIPKDPTKDDAHSVAVQTSSPFWKRNPNKAVQQPVPGIVKGTIEYDAPSGAPDDDRYAYSHSPQKSRSSGPIPKQLIDAAAAADSGSGSSSASTVPTFNKAALRRRKIEECLRATNVDMAEMRKVCWSGIPDDLRPNCWRILLGYAPTSLERREDALVRKREEYKALMPQYTNSDHRTTYEEEQLKQIHLDMPRFHLDHELFRQQFVMTTIERLLYLFALRHPVVGYVQGINDIASVFFVVFLREIITGSDWHEIDIESALTEDQLLTVEADTFWTLSYLIDGIQDSFTSDRRGLFRMISQIQEIVQKTDFALYKHLEEEEVLFQHFCTPWINCLLLRSFTLELTMRLWDTYFAEGNENVSSFHPYVCAAFLNSWSAQLKQLSFQEALLLLQRPPTYRWGNEEMEMLLSQAFLYQSLYKGSLAHLK